MEEKGPERAKQIVAPPFQRSAPIDLRHPQFNGCRPRAGKRQMSGLPFKMRIRPIIMRREYVSAAAAGLYGVLIGLSSGIERARVQGWAGVDKKVWGI
jgi:hypothetical protein